MDLLSIIFLPQQILLVNISGEFHVLIMRIMVYRRTVFAVVDFSSSLHF